MKYYFFKTCFVKSRERLRALPNQTFEEGSAVNPALNVSADKSIRSAYPLGTVFGSDSLTWSSGFYIAGDIKVMGIRKEDLKSPSHAPSEEMQNAYLRFIGSMSEEEKSEEKVEKPKKAAHSRLSKMMKNEDFNPPTVDKDGFYVDTRNWYLLLRNIMSEVPTILVGETGTGKTELIIRACKKIGIECNVYDMGSMYDPISGLLGVHRIDKNGHSIFDYAKFTKDIQKPGVILLDELSRAPVTTNNILFPCLDSRRELPVEIAGGEDLRSIKVNPECCFIATANIGSEYTGTNVIDKALMNRFFPLELSTIPTSAEIEVLTNRTGICKSDANNIVSVCTSIRNLYKKQEISTSISTREALMAASLVNDGWSLVDAMELTFLPMFEGTNMEGERSVVRKVFASR